jgi:hypothetical protein
MKSVAQQVAEILAMADVGTKFTLGDVYNRFTIKDRGAVYNAVWKMVNKEKVLPCVDGVYEVTQQAKDLIKTKSFKSAPQDSKSKRGVPAQKEIELDALEPATNPLEDLLSALALAEVEIRRLQELERKLKELGI